MPAFLHGGISAGAGAKAFTREGEHSSWSSVKRCPLLFSAVGSLRQGTPHSTPGRTGWSSCDLMLRLDFNELESCTLYCFVHGLADTLQRACKARENWCLKFCLLYSTTPLPVSETLLCEFVSFLAAEKLRHHIIKTSLSAVCCFQVRSRSSNPFKESHMTWFEYTMKGIKHIEAQNGNAPELYIPPHHSGHPIMRCIKEVWSASVDYQNTKLIWAVRCLGFFCFLWAGEMTTPEDRSYNSGVPLSFGDIVIDNLCCSK